VLQITKEKIMTSTHDGLAGIGASLTDEELDLATGGILPVVAVFVAGFAAGFSGAALYDLATN
jgi:hypothetical protein